VRTSPQRNLRLRACAATVLIGASGLLSLAAVLRPDSRGFGTHCQVGFIEPCGLLMTTGIPCPTCGMTTAFAHAVRGQVFQALRAQPLGCLLALTTMAAAVFAARTMVTGRAWALNWYRISPMVVVVCFAGLLLAAWAYKIAQVLYWS
jgi:hypothetical protein